MRNCVFTLEEVIDFTIQNVPIKSLKKQFTLILLWILQYKMFLLNKIYTARYGISFFFYNTKCSY